MRGPSGNYSVQCVETTHTWTHAHAHVCTHACTCTSARNFTAWQSWPSRVLPGSDGVLFLTPTSYTRELLPPSLNSPQRLPLAWWRLDLCL